MHLERCIECKDVGCIERNHEKYDQTVFCWFILFHTIDWISTCVPLSSQICKFVIYLLKLLFAKPFSIRRLSLQLFRRVSDSMTSSGRKFDSWHSRQASGYPRYDSAYSTLSIFVHWHIFDGLYRRTVFIEWVHFHVFYRKNIVLTLALTRCFAFLMKVLWYDFSISAYFWMRPIKI